MQQLNTIISRLEVIVLDQQHDNTYKVHHMIRRYRTKFRVVSTRTFKTKGGAIKYYTELVDHQLDGRQPLSVN